MHLPVPHQSWLGFVVCVFVSSLSRLGLVVSVLWSPPAWLVLAVCVQLPHHSLLGFVVCVFVRSLSWPGLWCPCFCTPALARDCAVCAFASSFLAELCGVCVCAHPSTLTPPALAELCGVCACALPRVFVCSLSSLTSVPRCFSSVHLLSWLGYVVLVLVPRHSWLGLGLSLVLECQWLVLCGLCVVGTLWYCVHSAGLWRQVAVVAQPWSCAVVVARNVPLWRALWPPVCAPNLVGSSRGQCACQTPFPVLLPLPCSSQRA